jgi:hypothetical protein
MRVVLQVVPVEFVYSLARVELRARKGEVGFPWAEYRPDERIVIVYSIPEDEYTLEAISPAEQGSMQTYGAEISRGQDGYVVRWTNPESRAVWFAFTVLYHELGHHYDMQYRTRRAPSRGRRSEEAFADQKARHILAQLQRGRRESRQSK